MIFKLKYLGVDLSSDNGRQWTSDDPDFKSTAETLQLEIAVKEKHNQDPVQITLENIKGIEWKTKEPDESSDDFEFR